MNEYAGKTLTVCVGSTIGNDYPAEYEDGRHAAEKACAHRGLVPTELRRVWHGTLSDGLKDANEDVSAACRSYLSIGYEIDVLITIFQTIGVEA